jgi:hypothetical protein
LVVVISEIQESVGSTLWVPYGSILMVCGEHMGGRSAITSRRLDGGVSISIGNMWFMTVPSKTTADVPGLPQHIAIIIFRTP